jgi:hypothetical protein
MKIGFIGPNLMKAGHDLVVHDVRREAAVPHLQAGAGWAAAPREVAEAAEVVFTSLPGPCFHACPPSRRGRPSLRHSTASLAPQLALRARD